MFASIFRSRRRCLSTRSQPPSASAPAFTGDRRSATYGSRLTASAIPRPRLGCRGSTSFARSTRRYRPRNGRLSHGIRALSVIRSSAHIGAASGRRFRSAHAPSRASSRSLPWPSSATGRIVTAPLGTVTAVARPERPSIDGPERKGSPLIAVCMATFNPDLELFRTQIESLQGTDRSGLGLLYQRRLLGVRALRGDHRCRRRGRSVRADARAGAARLLPELRAGPRDGARRRPSWSRSATTTIAGIPTSSRPCGRRSATLSSPTAMCGSSTPTGRVRGETLWRGRRNNHTNLASLLISNSIVGASCLFRRRVIDSRAALPAGSRLGFPRPLARARRAVARRRRLRRPPALRLRAASRCGPRPGCLRARDGPA